MKKKMKKKEEIKIKNRQGLKGFYLIFQINQTQVIVKVALMKILKVIFKMIKKII